MNELIESVDIWKLLVVYLSVLYIGDYSQLFFKDKKKMRDYSGNLAKPFYVLYWMATVSAIILTVLLIVIVVWKVILWVI